MDALLTRTNFIVYIMEFLYSKKQQIIFIYIYSHNYSQLIKKGFPFSSCTNGISSTVGGTYMKVKNCV